MSEKGTELETERQEQFDDDRKMMIDGEVADELLREGEAVGTLYEANDDGDLERSEIEIVNIAGPHPWYKAPPSVSRTPNTLGWRDVGIRAVPIAVTLAISAAALKAIPETTIAINQEPVVFPPTGAEFWGVMAVVAFIAMVVTILPYLPGKVGGVR